MAPVAYGEHDVYEPAIKALLKLWVKFGCSLYTASVLLYNIRFQPLRNSEVYPHYRNIQLFYGLTCTLDAIGLCGLGLSLNQRNQVRVT